MDFSKIYESSAGPFEADKYEIFLTDEEGWVVTMVKTGETADPTHMIVDSYQDAKDICAQANKNWKISPEEANRQEQIDAAYNRARY